MRASHAEHIEITAGFFLLVAICTYILPLKWLFGWFLAVLVHELSHIATLLAMGVHIYSVRMETTGAVIEAEPMPPWKEIISTLAGPVGGATLLLFADLFPQGAVCALVHSLYNLLPIYPLDGGRVLHCCAESCLGVNFATRFCFIVELVVLVGIVAISSYLVFKYHFSAIWVIAGYLLVIRYAGIKLSCKA